MELQEDAALSDPERLIQCPFVKHHHIRACRFPYHLVKCKESNPEVAKKLATCPFSAHISSCAGRAFVGQDTGSGPCEPPLRQGENESTWQAPPCDEDGETEVMERSSSAFVWGMSSFAVSSTIRDHSSARPSRMRAPETLPYAPSCRASSQD